MNKLARRFLFIGAAIAAVLTMGTAGYILIEHYPPLDAVYMALTTMTTVGYGEIHPLSPTGRIFNLFFIIFGVSAILVAMGAMTQTVIEMEFGDLIGKRRNKRMIDKLKDHFIICGYGRVGRGAAEELRKAGASFLVVDRRPERVEAAMRTGALAVMADSTSDDTLRAAGVERARGLVAALATDADNLFLLLSAKGLNPTIFVAARAAEEGAEEKMRRAGADSVFAPYSITGHRLAQTLLRPHVVQFLDFATSDLGINVTIEQIPVSGQSEVAGKSIAQLEIGKRLGVIVLAIRGGDGQMTFNPPADAAVRGGDHLIAMGKPESLRSLEGLLSGK